MKSTLTLGAVTMRDRTFDSVADAARSAGFTAIGMTIGQCLSAVERGIPLDQIPERLRDAGLRISELELVRLGEDGPVRHSNALVADLAASFQPDRVHAASWTGDSGRQLDEFAELCSRLETTEVCLEFMPYSAIPDLQSALGFITQIGQHNAKVVLDAVHFFRSGGSLEELTVAALAFVAVVQLSDVVMRPRISLATEARHLRTYPGEGTLDLVGLLRSIGATSAELPPLSLEPISDALETLPMSVVADRTMFSTLRILERAGLKLTDEGSYRADEAPQTTERLREPKTPKENV